MYEEFHFHFHFHLNENQFCTRTRFETEAEMAYSETSVLTGCGKVFPSLIHSQKVILYLYCATTVVEINYTGFGGLGRGEGVACRAIIYRE